MMPTDTFFRLPDEKRQRLMKAAKIEFSRHSLQEASIADIVKLADIPRGSFYQYFADKEDLYFHYYETLRKDRTNELIEAVDAAEGDIFEGFDQYFTFLLRDIFTGEDADFYRNLFLNMDYRAGRKVTDGPEQAKHPKHPRQGFIGELAEHINRTHLTIQSEAELHMFLHLIMTTVFSSIGKGYHERSRDPDYPIEKIVEDFKTALGWLKNGIYKKEGN